MFGIRFSMSYRMPTIHINLKHFKCNPVDSSVVNTPDLGTTGWGSILCQGAVNSEHGALYQTKHPLFFPKLC